MLDAGASSTVDCPSVIGGIGAWSAAVMNANLDEWSLIGNPGGHFRDKNAFHLSRDVMFTELSIGFTPYEKPFNQIFGKRN